MDAGNLFGIVWGFGMIVIGVWQSRRYRTEAELRDTSWFDGWMTRTFLRRELTEKQLRERHWLVTRGVAVIGGPNRRRERD